MKRGHAVGLARGITGLIEIGLEEHVIAIEPELGFEVAAQRIPVDVGPRRDRVDLLAERAMVGNELARFRLDAARIVRR
jgi:hypothetical protein